MRKKMRETDEIVDLKLTSASDYTVILENLPINYDKDHLLNELQTQAEDKIVKLIIAYQIQDYLKILKEKRKLIVNKKR